MRYRILVLLAAMAAICSCRPQYDVYLCIGQSNMAGRGAVTEADRGPMDKVFLLDSTGKAIPAEVPLNRYSSVRKKIEVQGVNPSMSFARSMAARSRRPILLVVQARGGTSINSWLPDAKSLKYTRSDDLGPKGEPMPLFFDEAVRRTRQAMRYGQLKGIIWHQGESDSDPQKAVSYMDRLETLVAALREALGAGDVPFVAGEIFERHRNAGHFNPIIREISSHIPNSGFVSSAGCLMNADSLHFSREGQILLGERYADALMALTEDSEAVLK